MFGSGLIKGLGVSGKHFFQREFTEQWPEQRPDLPPASQGFFDYDHSKCIGCGLCERACPNHVIKVTTEKNEEGKKVVTSYEMDIQYCLFCGLCIEACPTHALQNANNFESACYHHDSTNYEMTEDVAHEMNDAFNKLQEDYWTKKRPGGNPVGKPEPVKPVRPKPAAKPAAPGAKAPAAKPAAKKPAAPAQAAAPAEKPAAPAAPKAEAENKADNKEGKGATE